MKFRKAHRSHNRVNRADYIPTWCEIQSCKDMNISPAEYVEAKFYDGNHETANKVKEIKED